MAKKAEMKKFDAGGPAHDRLRGELRSALLPAAAAAFG
jgi:hypothetical protein